MSDKDDLIIPEEIRQAWDEIEPILDYGNTILETFNSCGLICKKIPITGDVINFILVWDEKKRILLCLIVKDILTKPIFEATRVSYLRYQTNLQLNSPFYSFIFLFN